ncbi:MAG: rod-binding protein [Syntrophobacteraceae bacterium]
MEANVELIPQADSSRELETQKRRLRENCREFESVMVSYMMKAMRDGTVRGEEPGSAREIYEDMFAGAVSKVISRSSALGVGDMLYSKLEPLVKARTSQGLKMATAEEQTAVSATSWNQPGAG